MGLGLGLGLALGLGWLWVRFGVGVGVRFRVEGWGEWLGRERGLDRGCAREPECGGRLRKASVRGRAWRPTAETNRGGQVRRRVERERGL